MISLLILSSLVYPATLLRKCISAASRWVMFRFVVTHVLYTYIYIALIFFFSHHVCEEHNLACDEDLLETVSNDVCQFRTSRKYDFKMQRRIILMRVPCIFYCFCYNQQIHNITTVCLYIIYTATSFMFAPCINDNQTLYYPTNAQYIICRYN